MINDLTLNTNLVKLRSDVWSAMTVVCTAGCDAGDFVQPFVGSSIVGVAPEAIAAGESGTIIYKAEAIVLPCDLSENVNAGTILSFLDGKIVNYGGGGIACAIAREAATTASTEVEVDLFGLLMAEEEEGT